MSGIFRGAFIMRLQDHHILTSTYFNTDQLDPQPETAKKISGPGSSADEFVGTYNSVWIEDDEPELMKLDIQAEHENSRYKMKWSEVQQGLTTPMYEGYAVKEKEILFGYYWKTQNNP